MLNTEDNMDLKINRLITKLGLQPHPAHTWFAASVNDTHSFSLVGCAVFPGFDFADFELVDAALIDIYPKLESILLKYMPVSVTDFISHNLEKI